MTVNREPTADELNGKNQITVHWQAKAFRALLVDGDGLDITVGGIPVSRQILRFSDDITVSGGTGTESLTTLDLSSTFIGVKGPNTTDEFTVTITDDDSGVIIEEIKSRTGDNGVARSKSLGLPLFDITITITDASADGTYTYLLMGV